MHPLVPGARVLVTGAGITGRSVSAVLEPTAVRLTICDDDPVALQRLITPATVVTTADAQAHISDYALVVTSPGFAPSTPVLAAAAAAGVPIWGDVELAWRLDRAAWFGPPRRWLVVTGTNGKTTTTSMLHAMLTADGRRAVLCGNIGNPVLDVLAEPSDLLAVELSSFQLHWAPSLRPTAGVVLNVAEDHLDWHGTLDDYARDKARVLNGEVAVVGLDDPVAAGLLDTAAAPVRVGFRLDEPAAGELGVRDGMLLDNAFGDGVALAQAASIPVAGPVGVLDALAAAALGPVGRRRARRHRRRAGRVPAGQAPCRGGRDGRRRHLCRRLQGHQPPRRAGVHLGLPAGGLGGRRPSQGCIRRRTGTTSGESAGRGRFDRSRSVAGRRGVIATRPGCPRRRACDGGGFWGG